MNIADIEQLIDQAYLKTPLPHPNSYLAAWHLLTATEDALRFTLVRTDISTGSIEYFFDRAKYSLKHGLERIRKECTETTLQQFPRRANPFSYGRGFDLLHAGKQYAIGCQICSSGYNGTLKLHESESTVTLEPNDAYHDKRYAVLEMIGHQPDDSVSFTQVIFCLLRSAIELPFIVEQIASSIKVKGKLIRYEYDSYLAADLSLIFSQSPPLIPEDWEFSFGGRHETTLLLNALSIRCAYHFIAVHFGANAKKLSGGGGDDLVLVISAAELCHDIEKLSSLPASTIRLFITELTYGNGVKSPDPALQPLYPLGGDLIAIPPLHVLSCHMERNLLALQARTQASTFNQMSGAFERDMIASTVKEIAPLWPEIKPNFTWKWLDEKEELDLIVADPDTKTLLICEMRWTIQPGDPREVEQRKKYCFEKVQQLERKIGWIKQNLGQALNDIFGICALEEDEWEVIGVVVIEGFGGVLSQNKELPVMPKKIFERAMSKKIPLRIFGNWAKSLAWLPKEGVFFEMHSQELDLGSKKIAYSGMQPKQERPDFLQHIDETISSAEMAVQH